MIVPLFPLAAVLFPGGRLPLRVFEPRYMAMVKECLRDDTPFGVCLIARGDEVAQGDVAPAQPWRTGTLARISDWDMAQLGIFNIVAQGEQRLRILRHWSEPSGLLHGEVQLFDAAPVLKVPDKFARVLPLLRAIIEELGEAPNAPALPHRYDDADWVSMRFAEILPIPALARQTLLEVDDGLDRLEIIYRFLASKALLPQPQ